MEIKGQFEYQQRSDYEWMIRKYQNEEGLYSRRSSHMAAMLRYHSMATVSNNSRDRTGKVETGNTGVPWQLREIIPGTDDDGLQLGIQSVLARSCLRC